MSNNLHKNYSQFYLNYLLTMTKQKATYRIESYSVHNTQATKQHKSPVNKPIFAFEKFSKR